MVEVMKRRVKDTLSQRQKKARARLIAALVVLGFLWVIFAPKIGVVSLINKRSELEHLQAEKQMLLEKNNVLQQKIERIEKDDAYLEQVARNKHGLLKKNEIVFEFPDTGKEKKKK